jgi:hypothetical protein
MSHLTVSNRSCSTPAEMRAVVVSFAPAPAPASTVVSGAACGCVGLGYGIAVAVGVLVLISTVALASYLCVLTKAGAAHVRTSDGAPAAPPTAVLITGLDGAAIDALYPRYPQVVAAADGPCAICLGEFAAGDALRRGPGCGHRFHAACAERWLRVSATCPVCRDSPLAQNSA